ncbi:MAG: hypothetical protein LUG91_06630 [Ruminococcus sp.]|nr:hypothetical protein [Ruminococcus sp.]
MRALTTELKKLFSNRIFLLIIAAVFVLNAYLMFRTANSGDSTPSDYKAIYSQLSGMTDEEKLDWLEERCGEYSGEHQYNWDVLCELRDECANIVGYQEYLENIESQAKSMTSVSIFAKPDTFNYRSIVKTPPAYENVQGVQPVFDVSKGIILATDNNFTDILCGFIVLFAVLSLMISDREQGMSGLLFPLKRGRGYLLLTKLAALMITIFCTILLIYCENLIISASLYGLGDLTRPVQSLSGFIGCNLKINVIAYLILYILFKFIAIFAIGAVLSLVAVNTKNTITFYGISAIILVAEGFAYAKIHPLSIYSIFRYINLISLTKVNEIFCNYKNINFWEYPVPLIPTSIGAVVVISIVSAALSAILYAKKRNLEFRRIGIKFKFGKNNKIRSKIYYTLYKSLIMQKGIFLIIIFVAVAGFLNQSFIKKYDVNDVYYSYYCETYEGVITSETLEKCNSEAQYFDDIQAKIDELNADGVYTSELSDLYKEFAPSMGFYPLQARIELIKDTDGAQIFYDTGYKRAFGIDGYSDDMKYAFAAMLLCIFLVSPLIANDNKYRMNSVVNATASGKKSYLRRNIAVAAIYGLIASLLWTISYAISISKYYNHNGLSAPIQCITDFADFPLNISVFQYIILIVLFRTIAIILASFVMLWVSSKCKNTTYAVLINFAVFALPILIYLLGAEFAANIGFNPLLSANLMLNDFSIIHLGILIPIVIIVAFEIKSSNLFKLRK